MFENPNENPNVPKILDLKSSFETAFLCLT